MLSPLTPPPPLILSFSSHSALPVPFHSTLAPIFYSPAHSLPFPTPTARAGGLGCRTREPRTPEGIHLLAGRCVGTRWPAPGRCHRRFCRRSWPRAHMPARQELVRAGIAIANCKIYRIRRNKTFRSFSKKPGAGCLVPGGDGVERCVPGVFASVVLRPVSWADLGDARGGSSWRPVLAARTPR